MGTAQLDVDGIEVDRKALVALYHATGGESWYDSTNWLTDRSLDEWQGVKTDSTGRVAQLFLYRNNLNGEIPAELANLSNLTSLAIWESSQGSSWKGLTGSIPAELGRLTNLTNLSLRENRLTGEIPAELGKLTNLYESGPLL